VLFQRECGNAVGDSDEGNDNHRYVRKGRAARNIVFMPSLRVLPVFPVDSGTGLTPVRRTKLQSLWWSLSRK
jgi:hypothetical protein